MSIWYIIDLIQLDFADPLGYVVRQSECGYKVFLC